MLITLLVTTHVSAFQSAKEIWENNLLTHPKNISNQKELFSEINNHPKQIKISLFYDTELAQNLNISANEVPYLFILFYRDLRSFNEFLNYKSTFQNYREHLEFKADKELLLYLFKSPVVKKIHLLNNSSRFNSSH